MLNLNLLDPLGLKKTQKYYDFFRKDVDLV